MLAAVDVFILNFVIRHMD